MEKCCSECSEPRLAQSLCTFCNKWLCYQCTDMHQHQRASVIPQCTDLHQPPRPTTTQCDEVHQREPSSLPPSEPGPGYYPRSPLMCHSHRQEPLELFCESCDLLCCSSCHLSTHKNHRLVHVGKALHEQQWLFESLMAQVEDKRSAVENTAKQIEDRLHGVKIMQRKAENQIKMAKMIMMNELNKRANLLIEQLEKISEDFQRHLEDQLQGAIEICGQINHLQNFITWATTHHRRSPMLFSRELISLQMQRLLETSLHSDSWVPVKIKFNWDPSYWTKQISSLGQLAVEGGNCSYSEGVACPSILRPQPITCLALPSACHRGREQGCGYQACCQPKMCCLHCIPSQSGLPSVDKSQQEANPYTSSYVQPTLTSSSLHQGQQLQRCWGTEDTPAMVPSSLQCHPSPVPTTGPVQLGCSHGSTSQPPPAAPQPKSQLHHQHQIEHLPESQAQPSADASWPGQGQVQGQGQSKQVTGRALQQPPGQTAEDREVMTEEDQEEKRKEQTHGQTALVDRREVLRGGLQQGRKDQTPPPSQQQQQQPQASPAAELRKELQETRPPHQLRDSRDGRRSSSLETSVTARGCGVDVQSSRLSSTSVCGRRESRSQSIPAELTAPSTILSSERPPGPAHCLGTGASDQYRGMDHRQRRASDGVIQCVTRETSSATPPSRGQSRLHRSALLSYKTEPDNTYGYINEESEYEAKGKYRISRKSRNNSAREVQKDSGSQKVPVVCLERLKILVSRLPPHGRRQSDPLPASGVERNGAVPQQRAWGGGMAEGLATRSKTRGTTLSLITPPYTDRQRQSPSQSTTPLATSEFHNQERHSPCVELPLPALSTNPKHVDQLFYEPDLDSDSDPRSASEPEPVFEPDPESDPQLESDPSPESDPHPESSSEAQLEMMANEESEAAGESGPCAAAGESEPSVEYEADPESDVGAGSENCEKVDADWESGDADAESDLQPESDPGFHRETDSDMLSDQPTDSRGSVESGPDLESEPDFITDEPQPLCSDQESPFGPGQRHLLMANPDTQSGSDGAEENQPLRDNTEIESEDFCAVCLIGGDLLCCDRCPKVFHLSCHVPSLLSFPKGDWVCTLCRDITQPEVEYDCENERTSGEHTLALGLSEVDQRKCERLTLLIFSNILSAPFHEPVSPLARHYYQIIKRPMDLSVIRAKLNKRNTCHYYSPEEFVVDVFLMFRNCAKFNYPDSEVAQAGRSLEAFFSSKLREVFANRAFTMAAEDSDSDEYDEAYRANVNGFPWPERKEQCHRKRKRRHSLNSRRHHL